MAGAECDGFILAAGLGTRMGPLSRVLPKPAWTLCGLPILRWGAENMRREGLLSLGCNAHHLAPNLRNAAAAALTVFEEPTLLGSAGGLQHIQGSAADPLAVWNGDAIAEIPWRFFVEAHKIRRAQLSWLLTPHAGGPWNPVWLDREGWILPLGETGEGPYHFTGAALWGAEALSLIPQGYADTKRDVLPKIQRHAGIVTAPFPWREVGTPDQLIQAACDLAPEHEGRVLDCYVHPAAHPAGRLHRCILGPDVHLHPTFEDQNGFWFMDGELLVRLPLSTPV